MSEKKPDTPVVHLPWSHYQAITARLDALEAREKARDEWLTTLQCAVLPFKDRADLSRVGKAFERFVDQIQAAPPPPAAAPEPDLDRARRRVAAARESFISGRDRYLIVEQLNEALRLLGARP